MTNKEVFCYTTKVFSGKVWLLAWKKQKTNNILKDNTQEIVDLIRSNLSVPEKKERLNDYHENDIADVLNILTVDERKKLYQLLGLDKTSEIFSYLEEDVGTYLEELDAERAPISLRAWTPMMP